MTARFIKNAKEKFNTNYRKDNHFNKQMTAVVYDYEKDKLEEAVELRIYKTDGFDYCCLWTYGHSEDMYRHGTGRAGGGGYHRASAAACEAIYNAGIELSEAINGRGDSMMREAIESIADEMYSGRSHKVFVIEAHA